jgi:hypothetical protein
MNRVGPSIAWLVVVGLGVAMLTMQGFVRPIPDSVQVPLYVMGTFATVLGGAGLGKTYAPPPAPVMPPYRRTAYMFGGLDVLDQIALAQRSRLLQSTRGGRLATSDVTNAFDILETAIREQLRSRDQAVAEWNDVLRANQEERGDAQRTRDAVLRASKQARTVDPSFLAGITQSTISEVTDALAQLRATGELPAAPIASRPESQTKLPDDPGGLDGPGATRTRRRQ